MKPDCIKKVPPGVLSNGNLHLPSPHPPPPTAPTLLKHSLFTGCARLGDGGRFFWVNFYLYHITPLCLDILFRKMGMTAGYVARSRVVPDGIWTHTQKSLEKLQCKEAGPKDLTRSPNRFTYRADPELSAAHVNSGCSSCPRALSSQGRSFLQEKRRSTNILSVNPGRKQSNHPALSAFKMEVPLHTPWDGYYQKQKQSVGSWQGCGEAGARLPRWWECKILQLL